MPDANPFNEIHGVLSKGNTFIPDVTFQVPHTPSPGILSAQGAPSQHGLLHPPEPPLSTCGFTADPSDLVSGKLSPFSSPTNLISGLMTKSDPLQFRAYNPLEMQEGSATFTPDSPVGATPQGGILTCADPSKVLCTFNPLKAGAIPGKLINKTS